MAQPDARGPLACVVIPTYNEAENIAPLLETIHALGSGGPLGDGDRLAAAGAGSIRAIVVDDASADGTGRIVQECAARLGGIELLERPAKLGLGTAYTAGFLRAFALEARYVLTMDADFSHDPARIPDLLAAVTSRNADLAIGSRYVPGGRTLNWGLHRQAISRTANWLAHRMLGLTARDCTSGYRCYRASFLRTIDFENIRTNGYSYLVEMLYLCQGRGARIVEVPIVFRNREHGRSKISQVEIYKAIGTLWRLMRARRHGRTRGRS
jgi:glycosyltransferase involved in cell wall biosynthesis